MTILQAIILGIIQGATEFLPVSSSGHLVLAHHLFGWDIPADQAFSFDVLVQMGTIVPVIGYFWKDLVAIVTGFARGLWHPQTPPPAGGLRGVWHRLFNEETRMGWLIIFASIPAGLFGLLFKDQIEAAFASPYVTAGFLLLTALLLVIAEKVGQRNRDMAELTTLDAVVIGLFQMLAVFPGVSRSGTTITGGMVRHLNRQTAARFSFLMSVPIMLAAGGLSVFDLRDVANLSSFIPPLIVGFFTSAIVGYLSIRWLLGFLQKRSLYGFAVYVTVVAVGVFLILLF